MWVLQEETDSYFKNCLLTRPTFSEELAFSFFPSFLPYPFVLFSYSELHLSKHVEGRPAPTKPEL